MNRQNLKQAFKLIAQNRFFSIISIIGTAITIAFVMVAYMAYECKVADLAPEINRSNMIFSGPGRSFRTADNTERNTGMSKKTAHILFDSLPGIDMVSYYGSVIKLPGSSIAGGNDVRLSVRPCDRQWFDLFDYRFIAGSVFNEGDVISARRVAVITESTARRIFHDIDVVGKEFMLNFSPVRVVGIVKDVTTFFEAAYAEVWMPVKTLLPDAKRDGSAGLRGNYLAILVKDPNTSFNEVKTNVERRLQNVQSSFPDFSFLLYQFRQQRDETFQNDDGIPRSLLTGLFIVILLVVPAINISGLTQSQISQRLGEIGIRKAYGASRGTLFSQLTTENMILTLLGGVLGYIIACLIILFAQDWFFGIPGTAASSILTNWTLFIRPEIFIVALLACIVFNLLSVLIPAWWSVRKPVTEIIRG